MRPIYFSTILTPFKQWIHANCKGSTHYGKNPGYLTISDVDFIFRDYNRMLLKMVEEKVLGKKNLERAQTEILRLVDLALKDATRVGGTLQDWRYEGFFVITFSKLNPEDSKSIWINGIEVDKEQLRQFLNFDLKFEELTKE
jgi:hypothetical protein